MTGGREVAAATGPVSYALARATKAHRVELQRRLAKLDLYLGQELVLVDIHQHPGTTQGELVGRIGIEQPTAAKAIARMERAGFVERCPDPGDRRVIRLRLTRRGQAAVTAVVNVWAELERVATKGLTAAEVAQLLALLNRIRDNHA